LSKKREDFENKLKRLEEITSKLESGELGLEESIEAYREGIELSRSLIATLREAEKKIQLIQKEAVSEFESIEEFDRATKDKTDDIPEEK
jgi:exodeoxyribonuclease VII small subunit